MWDNLIHAAELAWFYGEAASDLGQRSTAGAQLEALERGSCDSDGHRIGTRARIAEDTWRSRSCRVAVGLSAVGDFDPDLTAQPTLPRDRQGEGFTPSDYHLRRFAEVSQAVSRLDPLSAEVLRLYFEAGDRWSTGPRGKLIPVMVITTGGRMLLEARRSRKADARQASKALLHQGHEVLRPDEQVADELRDQARNADSTRRFHLTMAAKQAQTLLASAREDYATERPMTAIRRFLDSFRDRRAA